MKKTVVAIVSFVIGICMMMPASTKAEELQNDNMSGLFWTDYAAETFSDGDGSSENPYLISDASELALLSKLIKEDTESYDSKYYKLTNNIDLKGHYWEPIGYTEEEVIGNFINSHSFYFDGYFDGDNYTVDNMKLYQRKSQKNYGLFGIISGTVKNLTITNADINLNITEEGWYSDNGMGSSIYLGILAGEIVGGDIALVENCVVDGQVKMVCADSTSCGGLAGSINYANVKNCFVNAFVDVSSAKAICIGGLTGAIYNECVISGCGFRGQVKSLNDGTITGRDDLTDQGYSWVHYAGGFAGCIGRATGDKQILDCYTVADVIAKSADGGAEAGGFTGCIEYVYQDFILKNLFCDSTVTTYKGEEKLDEFKNFSDSRIYSHDFNGEEYNIDISNCGYIENGKIKVYKTVKAVSTDDFSGSLEVGTEYSLATNQTASVFLNHLGYDKTIWNMNTGMYPSLRIEDAYFDIGSNKLVLTKGQSGKIAVKQRNMNNAGISWTTSNSKIATVDRNGNVTAVAVGNAVITATVGNTVKSCNLIVEEPLNGKVVNNDGYTYYYVNGILTSGHVIIGNKEYYFDLDTKRGHSGWLNENGASYWYEDGERQGYTINDSSYRGKEIYDSDTDAWYWLDNVQKGAKAVSKDVYQESNGGKWVRYNEDGLMIKEWDEQNGNIYYFDLITGAMLHGDHILNGQSYHFDEVNGTMFANGWLTVNDKEYWYENGIRQGYNPNNTAYRGKEIYDSDSDAWYWLDNVQQGAKAVGKDVYQESNGGKWVRYDSNGGMIKGWNVTANGTYYFDLVTGAMQKGTLTIDGVEHRFNDCTGVMEY